MKINKLQINGFGSIENKELIFNDKINLLYGKNESGKSTIANFIKCVFYGVNRNKAGNDCSELELRKPWKNIDFSGKLEYECNGKKYTVYRDFNRNNCKVYDEDGTDITKDFNKDKVRGTEVGLEHLGIDEETFMNSLFISQDHSEVEPLVQKSMIQKLTNILQSGQENISFDKIKSRLQKKIIDEIGTERTHNKPINLIKREIIEKKQTRNRLLNNRGRKKDLEKKQKDIESQINDTKSDMMQIGQVIEIKEKYKELLDEKERMHELSTKIKDKERQEKINKNKKQYKMALIILWIITIITCIALILFNKTIWIVLEILLAILGVLLLKYTNKITLPKDETVDFDVVKEELNKKEIKELDRLNQKGVKATYTERKLYELKKLQEGYEKKKNDLLLESHKIKIEEDNLKENIEHLAEVEEQLVSLEEKQEVLQRKARVIGCAIEQLEDAYDELKSEMIPELQANIKSKIEKTTNGKYVNAIYNNEDGIIVENSFGEYVSVNRLSVATIDQMYMGFRLGIAEKMGNIPLILDESFAYYDNERLENILNSLKDTDRQIIILTCSNREKEIFEKLKISYHYLEI